MRERIEAGHITGSVEMLDDILQVMVNMFCFCRSKDTVRIARTDMPSSVVSAQFSKVNMEHVIYVMEGLSRTKKKLMNPSAVIQTSLYNSVSSMNTYYETEVRIDQETPNRAGYHRRE
jgi:hypothetical protein